MSSIESEQQSSTSTMNTSASTAALELELQAHAEDENIDVEEAVREEFATSLSVSALNQLQAHSYHLTDAQQGILEKFKEMVNGERSKMTNLQIYYCFHDEPKTLIRYLKARDWDLNNSFKLLKSSLTWIESSYKPYQLTAKQLWFEASAAKIYIRGFDKANRPIIYLHAGRDLTKDPVVGLYLLVYTLIAATYRVSSTNGQECQQITWICDFRDYTTKSAPPLSVCKQAVEILGSHFPERLGLCLMVHAPKVFHWFYKIISPFIPPVTKQKIQFCKGTKHAELRAFMEPFIDVSQLDKSYGGDKDIIYNHEEQWREEMEWDKKRIMKMKEHGAIKEQEADQMLNEPVVNSMDKHVKFFKNRKH
ncbi:hypothetical protein C9374_005127 [Naegleria lovaniensis]|uniref:CRAL-TRIO domain-containing protein n=1 Tax=Naegleria lovaniensis TaxID=51637 RepID=A0AA88KIS9_NAELO|nr:uncharacterized protein C9374_005127 [Naegleria lovaniensis]KAG2382547.1 hypothetical protein C9374_005127 [Naegleria lovaniensis]